VLGNARLTRNTSRAGSDRAAHRGTAGSNPPAGPGVTVTVTVRPHRTRAREVLQCRVAAPCCSAFLQCRVAEPCCSEIKLTLQVLSSPAGPAAAAAGLAGAAQTDSELPTQLGIVTVTVTAWQC
jgi:hypothetical protein